MHRGPAVLLLDDGELDDIQQLLEEQEVAFARVRGGAIVAGTPPPTDLLIATPRRVSAVQEITGPADPTGPVRVVVVNEDSHQLRTQLRASGFEFMVRRPVHPEALRLLVMRCLYRGEERRGEPRVAVGFEVSFRTGLLARRAVLADLSLGGCRLLSRNPLDKGRRIRVQVPDALEADPISITGRILRVEKRKDSDLDVYDAAVRFDELDPHAREVLGVLIEDLSTGPATLRRLFNDAPAAAGEEPPAAEEREAPAVEAPVQLATSPLDADEGLVPADDSEGDSSSAGSRDERRDARRGQFDTNVPAFGKRALRVLVGRDLSQGGMRIEPLPSLELGDRLHLAIYAEAGEPPFLVWATVTRDDGAAGMALAFDPLGADVEQRLESLVASLPAVESLGDSETEAMGTVLSEVLED